MALEQDHYGKTKQEAGQALGAEKSPRKVGVFVAAGLLGVILLMCLVLLYLHTHSLSMR